MPQISVIVPVYKVEPYLHRCVDSILAQTFTDFELILVDDGSPDNCGAICDEYAVKDARVHVIHQENGGLSAARNAGINWAFANSDSQWLTFVDSDDWIHPRMLEQLYRAVQEHGVKVSVCGYCETEGDDPWEEGELSSKLWPVEQYYVEHNVNATIAVCKLYHKSCFEQMRYPVGRIHEDEFVTYRVLFEYEQIAVIDSPMYAYFVNPQGITKSGWTPKRLDGLLAYQQQLYYFKRNGYVKAYCAQAVKYIRKLCLSIKAISNSKAFTNRRRILVSLKKDLMLGLIRYRNDSIFDQNNLWIYEETFPELMNAYWICRAVKDKVFKRSR